MGSAACSFIARRGASVIGIERFSRAHDRGSSHGHSRVYRESYHEHPDYVPLLMEAGRQWEQLESRVGSTLLIRCGVLYISTPGGQIHDGVLESASTHGLECRILQAEQLREEYPQFRVMDEYVGILEPNAGFIDPERAIQAWLLDAEQAGATIMENTPVRSWEETGDCVRIELDDGVVEVGSLIVCSGAWTSRVIGQLGVPLHPTRQVIGWLRPDDPGCCEIGRMPVWLIDTCGNEPYYGIPTWPDQLGPEGMKVALHGAGTPTDPDQEDGWVRPEEIERLRSEVLEHVPGAVGSMTHATTCMYTNSPDGDFIIDRVPGCDRTWFAAGFSGHGFKFSSVMGRVMSDLSLDRRTDLPIEFLSLDRFDPSRSGDDR